MTGSSDAALCVCFCPGRAIDVVVAVAAAAAGAVHRLCCLGLVFGGCCFCGLGCSRESGCLLEQCEVWVQGAQGVDQIDMRRL